MQGRMRLKFLFVAFVGKFRESTSLAAPSTGIITGREVRILRRSFLHFSLLLSGRIIFAGHGRKLPRGSPMASGVEPLLFLKTSIARSIYNRMAGLELRAYHD